MPTKRTRRTRGREPLNHAQFIELLLGPKGQSAFDDDDHRRRAWLVNRDQFLPCDSASLPWGAREYENTTVQP